MKLIAKTIQGLEEIVAEEMAVCGARNIEIGRRVVSFVGNKEVMYRANLFSHCAIRILKPIRNFFASNESALYRGIQDIDWSKYLSHKDTLAVDAVCNSEFFKHSKYAALKTKDAIVDQIREETGKRPNVDVKSPTYKIHVHINDTEVSISLDSSRDALFKRGYRSRAGEAPMNEVLAAGMIKLSGWDGSQPLVDMTCGSGTICIEAARMASGLPPHLKDRKFGFETWRDFDYDLWNTIKQDAYASEKRCPSIIGLDINGYVLRTARENAKLAGVDRVIHFKEQDLLTYLPETESGFIISNPPYDERLQIKDIEGFYASIGDTFKTNFKGWQAWIISANIPALKRIGLKPSRRIPIFNGPLECRIYKFEMYAGSKKGKWIAKKEAEKKEAEK